MKMPSIKGEPVAQGADNATLPKYMHIADDNSGSQRSESHDSGGSSRSSVMLAVEVHRPSHDNPWRDNPRQQIIHAPVKHHWFVDQGYNSDGDGSTPPQPVPPPKDTRTQVGHIASSSSNGFSNPNHLWSEPTAAPSAPEMHIPRLGSVAPITDRAAPLPKLECKHIQMPAADPGGGEAPHSVKLPADILGSISAHGQVASAPLPRRQADQMHGQMKLKAAGNVNHSEPPLPSVLGRSPASSLKRMSSPLSSAKAPNSIGFDSQGMMKVPVFRSQLSSAALFSGGDWGVSKPQSYEGMPGASSSLSSSGSLDERIPSAGARRAVPIQRIFTPPDASSSRIAWKPSIAASVDAPRYRATDGGGGQGMSCLLPPLQAPHSSSIPAPTRLSSGSALAVSRVGSGADFSPSRASSGPAEGPASHSAGDFKGESTNRGEEPQPT